MSAVRCYYCGRTIEDEEDLVMKNVNTGFLELSQSRHPFHEGCWKEHRRKTLIRNIKMCVGLPLLFAAIILFIIFLPYIFG